MNLFDFYRSVALRWMGKTSFSAADIREISKAYHQLCSDFHGDKPVSYVADEAKLAYLLVFAPRHAIYWRHYCREKQFRGFSGMTLNSVGTGPASEVVGFLEGATLLVEHDENDKPVPFVVNLTACDTEVTWRPVQDAVAQEYRRTGRVINPRWTNDVANLLPATVTLASYLLSDLARQNAIEACLSAMRDSVKPTLGIFLDTATFKREDKELYVSREIPDGFDRKFDQIGVGLKDIANKELDACATHEFKKPLDQDPALNAFFMRLS